MIKSVSNFFLKGGLVIAVVLVLLLGIVYLNEYLSSKAESKAIVGKYKFDYNFSEFRLQSKTDSAHFENLYLIIDKDHRFHFSQPIPFFKGFFGTWDTEGFGMNDWITLKTDSGYEYQLGNCCGEHMETTISYPLDFRDVTKGYGRIGDDVDPEVFGSLKTAGMSGTSVSTRGLALNTCASLKLFYSELRVGSTHF